MEVIKILLPYNWSGDIVMVGLGLGNDVRHVLSFPEVNRLHVVEREQAIIDLFPLDDPRLSITCATWHDDMAWPGWTIIYTVDGYWAVHVQNRG